MGITERFVRWPRPIDLDFCFSEFLLDDRFTLRGILTVMEKRRDRRVKFPVISRKKFGDFVSSHPAHADALPMFYEFAKTLEAGVWKNFSDLRAVFSSADLVGPLVVFNLGGNKDGVAAKVLFQYKKVFTKHVLTHSEYDRGLWKTGPRD